MSVEIREVSDFDQIRFRGPGICKIIQGDTESLNIHAPAYMMGEIESSVSDSVLHLGYVSPRVVSLRVQREIISYELYVKDISRMVVLGSGRIVVPDLDNDAVKVEINGSGQICLDNLTADKLVVEIKGSGRVKVAGDVEMQSLSISGSGRYEAQQLVSDFAQAKISGSGQADVSVSDDLSVIISGSGKISYGGYPDVSKVISGSGKVLRRRRDKQISHQERKT
ncbi:MAG: DUF2807 domain-containing protein [Pseudomonadales bacterium]|jgi:hypothetical protein